jgi:hypothetical protein
MTEGHWKYLLQTVVLQLLEFERSSNLFLIHT